MNRTGAIFKKQIKDTLKNKATLIQFILFPIIAFLFTELVAKANADLPDTYFATMFSTMYIGMVPLVNMASIISEERENKSLRMLVMSNVKPFEYLIGVGGYVMLCVALGGAAFGLMSGHRGAELFKYELIMITGAFASLLLGAAVGIFSKNQGAATAMAMPLAMIAAFVPMVAMFNEVFLRIAKYLYSQQISFLIDGVTSSGLEIGRFGIIGANMLVFLAVFIAAYRKADLKD